MGMPLGETKCEIGKQWNLSKANAGIIKERNWIKEGAGGERKERGGEICKEGSKGAEGDSFEGRREGLKSDKTE